MLFLCFDAEPAAGRVRDSHWSCDVRKYLTLFLLALSSWTDIYLDVSLQRDQQWGVVKTEL